MSHIKMESISNFSITRDRSHSSVLQNKNIQSIFVLKKHGNILQDLSMLLKLSALIEKLQNLNGV
jgi:hypothetical protein